MKFTKSVLPNLAGFAMRKASTSIRIFDFEMVGFDQSELSPMNRDREKLRHSIVHEKTKGTKSGG